MIGITLKNGGTPTPPQVVNYQMLYYLGDECTDVTGGWSVTGWQISSAGQSLAIGIKNTDNLYIYYTASTLHMFGVQNAVDCEQFNKLYLNWECTGILSQSGRSFGINFALANAKNISDRAVSQPNVDRNVRKISEIDISSLNDSYYPCTYPEWSTSCNGKIYGVWLVKQDNISGLSTYGADIASIIANASSLLADAKAVEYMIYNCTGDFMASAIADIGFITALNASANKNLVLANEHWAKFLALV